jgi:membrane associated rhomboid family serine protease
MFLPLSDAPNPRDTPVMTYLLIAANVLIYLFITVPLSHRPPQRSDPALVEYVRTIEHSLPPGVPLQAALRHVSAYDVYVFEHGFRPAKPSLRDLLVSMFLHAGFMHLFGNMLFLWIYGDNVEFRLGRLRYLLFYLLTGAAATLFFSLFALGSNLPLIGASGAISGVLGFYFIWFPRNVVNVFLFLFPFFMNVVQIPARFVLGIYLVLDNLLPFLLQGGRASGVAHGAHLGGFLAGVILAKLVDRRETNAAPEEFRPRAAPGEKPPPLTLSDAIRQGHFAAAAEAYFALDPDQTRRLLSPEESLALADWLARNGHPAAALTVYRRHLRDYPRGPGVAEAHLGAGQVLFQEGQMPAAYQHFLDALDADPPPAVAAQARQALAEITARQKYGPGGLHS